MTVGVVAGAARKGGDVFRRHFASTTGIAGILAAILFLRFPEIDLTLSRVFYIGERAFLGHQQGLIVGLRWLFICSYFSCIGLAFAGVISSRRTKGPWMSIQPKQWLFLAVCLAAGPGLVANFVLKDHWGRARPSQISEFGGSKAFTAPLIPVNECRRNCSFVSGEASCIFIPFYAAAMVIPQWSVTLAILGTLGGFAVGLLRMSQGAHFLSDVVFAGVFMALTVLAVHRVMFDRRLLSRLAVLFLRWAPTRS